MACSLSVSLPIVQLLLGAWPTKSLNKQVSDRMALGSHLWLAPHL